MSYRGIKRILGESSLERKTQLLFAVCLLVLITAAFLWVSRITEHLIDDNTRDQANSLKSDFVLRTHLENLESFYTASGASAAGIDRKQDATATVFASLATVSPTVPYETSGAFKSRPTSPPTRQRSNGCKRFGKLPSTCKNTKTNWNH